MDIFPVGIILVFICFAKLSMVHEHILQVAEGRRKTLFHSRCLLLKAFLISIRGLFKLNKYSSEVL